MASSANNPPDTLEHPLARRLSGWSLPRWLPLTLLSAPLLLFLTLPLVALLLRVPLDSLIERLGSRAVLQAVSLSFVSSTLTVVNALVFGTPLAYLLARRRFRGRQLLDTLIDLPMVLPPTVAGIALLLAFGRRGLLGQHFSALGIEIAFTQVAVVLAQSFVAVPLYVKAAAAGFAAVDHEFEQAAALDGASGWQVLRHVTLPLAAGALLGGAVMSWARALGEFGATIIFAGNLPGRTQTMPLAIYLGFELDLDLALTLAAILLLTSCLVLFVVKRLLHQQVA